MRLNKNSTRKKKGKSKILQKKKKTLRYYDFLRVKGTCNEVKFKVIERLNMIDSWGK